MLRGERWQVRNLISCIGRKEKQESKLTAIKMNLVNVLDFCVFSILIKLTLLSNSIRCYQFYV